ncbi:MAG TPA: MFS transporter [Candidatus Limnocylindrales bacterium]
MNDLDRLRRRTVRILVLGVALGSTGHLAALTVATVVAERLSGSPALAGTPAAAVVLGAAFGATILAWIMSQRGRRFGLALGYLVGVGGALVAVAGIVAGQLMPLLAGSALIGFGNSSNQLSRYAAADLFGLDRRASAIGTVVWAATVGAIVGPNLVAPSRVLAERLGLPDLAGPYLVPVLFVGLASLLSFMFLRPDPMELAASRSDESGESVAEPLSRIVRRPAVVAALVALVVGQFVMVLIMTLTPLHMTTHGHDLGAVGFVISAHTFGMFALAPISGRLTDRFGSPPIVYAGTATLLVSGVLTAIAPPDSEVALLIALFLLGWGWNLGFVAGSAMLTGGVSIAERTRIQGLADGLIWSTAALASLGAGVIVGTAGFAALGVIAAALVLVPIAVLTLTRGRIPGAGGAGSFEPIGD